MIFLPPRHGKSMDVTETFPSYFIGKDPERRVIQVSYGSDLAETFGYNNKKKVKEFGKELFDITIDKSNDSKTDWGIEGHRGGMISVGIGGGITGKGANLLLIDDPIKNRKEANSEAYRRMLWDEWQNSLLTRLHPGGAVIIILTRWHEKDLAGRLLEEDGRVEDGGKWHVVELPAECDSENDLLGRKIGEPLWPEHGFDLEWLINKKREVGSYVFASLYQQKPRPRDAVRLFQREWFEIVDDWPRDAKEVRFWDLAATEPKPGKDPDYTAGGRVAEKDGIYYIVDMVRFRKTPMDTEETIKRVTEQDGKRVHVWMEEEGGSSGKIVADHYRRTVLKGYTFRTFHPTGDKMTRAMPVSAAAEAGNVKLVRGAWNKDFLDEADVFATGTEDHDDQVDTISGAFEALNRKKIMKSSTSSKI